MPERNDLLGGIHVDETQETSSLSPLEPEKHAGRHGEKTTPARAKGVYGWELSSRYWRPLDFIAWAVIGGRGGDSPSTTTTEATGTGPIAVSAGGLATLTAALNQPIYW